MSSRAKRQFQFEFPEHSGLMAVRRTITVQLNGKLLLPSAEALGLKPYQWPEWIKVSAGDSASETFWHSPGHEPIPNEAEAVALAIYVSNPAATYPRSDMLLPVYDWNLNAIYSDEAAQLERRVKRAKGHYRKVAEQPFRMLVTE